MIALGRAVLQCYYRDDRVFRALGIEPRAPYPKGQVLEHAARRGTRSAATMARH
jgi:hypothetical protein